MKTLTFPMGCPAQVRMAFVTYFWHVLSFPARVREAMSSPPSPLPCPTQLKDLEKSPLSPGKDVPTFPEGLLPCVMSWPSRSLPNGLDSHAGHRKPHLGRARNKRTRPAISKRLSHTACVLSDDSPETLLGGDLLYTLWVVNSAGSSPKMLS